ncbi:multicomponent Na+:H+ antiporter subunit G [Rhizobium sp. RU20A]|uniref:monovalent cation/H(+) antiporter subunit G n=1 Tax=Rhizobium sp. RU20A TaxID=1907412 RepID=UPI000953C213|nr:monovalent cation/H(+) antiporter subunit G [Rhizobium sp. RU20A]SIR16611.1 multicomponent Na+:H+ antiporter subunit G [Rhizobium sp. RU20A]
METALPLILSGALAVLVVVGALFTLTAAIGLLRFPDLFTRMHAASKAGTVGASLLLLAAGLHTGELYVLFRALAGVVFFVLTAPISAHLLAKAAHEMGYRLSRLTVRDDLKR